MLHHFPIICEPILYIKGMGENTVLIKLFYTISLLNPKGSKPVFTIVREPTRPSMSSNPEQSLNSSLP